MQFFMDIGEQMILLSNIPNMCGEKRYVWYIEQKNHFFTNIHENWHTDAHCSTDHSNLNKIRFSPPEGTAIVYFLMF